MIKRIKEFFGLISDSAFALQSGMSLRFVLANLIMRDELRQAVAFARIDVEIALKYYDIAPDISKRKLKQAFDGLSSLFSEDVGR